MFSMSKIELKIYIKEVILEIYVYIIYNSSVCIYIFAIYAYTCIYI